MVKAKVQQDGGAMKKILLLVLAVTMVGSLAFGQTQVLSRNAVGYVKVDAGSNNLAMCTLNFNAFDNRIISIFTNQLTGGGNKDASDQILKWDPVGKVYIIFWKTPTGQWRQFPSTGDATNTLQPGETFWIRNTHTSNQTVYLMGEVPDSSTAPTRNVSVISNLNMVAYSYPTEIAITNLNLPNAKSGGNKDASDNILVWNPVAKAYKIYWRSPVGWRLFPGTSNTWDTIQPGQGFWYKRLSNSFTWVENKPYTWP
jgi:hypothetical protein